MKSQIPVLQTASRSGYTLIELMAGVAISGLVLAGTAGVTVYSAESMAALGNYDDLNHASRNALDTMTENIRQAGGMTYFATNQLIFTNLDGSPLSFTYQPAAGLLRFTNGGNSGVLLANIESLSFTISQRNPSNSFTFYPATGASQAKMVAVNWKCSKPLFFQKLINTESIQTANIIVRN